MRIIKYILLLFIFISSCGTENSVPTIASPSNTDNPTIASSSNIDIPAVVPSAATVTPTTPSLPDNVIELWQLPSQSTSQMMSYVVKRGDKDLIVIDGGMTADAEYLKAFIKNQTVNAWIVTHTHPDHVNALISLLESNTAPKIQRIYWAFVDRDWLLKQQPSGTRQYDNFLSLVEAAGIPLQALSPDDRFTVGALNFIVLSGANPGLPGLNNSSLVFKLLTPRTVLFLADLVDDRALLPKKRDLLPSDIVQMSHHGQAGLTKEVYKAIHPKICLWPSTRWLWDNDNGNGPGSGSWTTPEARSWMKELGVQQHIVQADGLQKVLLSIPTEAGE
jgi:beta-lactamase superfamily II metal-dependent hydrolase